MTKSVGLVIDFARSDQDVDHVKALFLEYLKFIEVSLGESLCFQDTEREFKDLRAMYDDMFLARLTGTPSLLVALNGSQTRNAN